MARPLGYGRIRISIVHSDVFDMQGARAKLDDCRNSFETYMESCVPGWTHSPQIEELRALAQPVEPTSAEYQRLDPGGFRNDFSDAKIEGLALPSAFNHKSSGPSQQNGQRAPVHSTQRPPHTPIPKPAPPINPRATPQPIAGGKPWRTKERGDVIEVTLTEQNRKGKWRCTVNGYAGTQGTLGGKVPDDAAPGKTVRAVVVVGNDPKNLELQWPE